MNMSKAAPIFILMLILSSCAPVSLTAKPDKPGLMPTTTAESPTTTQAIPTAESTPASIPIEFVDLTLGIEPAVPADLRAVLEEYTPFSGKVSDVQLGLVSELEPGAVWVYALVAPFSSLVDNLSFEDLQAVWQRSNPSLYTIYLEDSSLRALEAVLGAYGGNVVVLPAEDILAAAWKTVNSLAIVPFEALEPRWKVITLDGQSPIHNDFSPDQYPLKAKFGWKGEADVLHVVDRAVEDGELIGLTGNRDPQKLTVLVMTGVTALVRATAVKMEEKGMTYPGEDIRDWLTGADLTHISNEVSFSPVCPDPVSSPGPLIFCSKPEYIELLDYVGTDILELTGNHGIDWGRDALTYSLGLYNERGWAVYASGENAAQAREAVTVEHNGNRLAFIGCNPAGPEFIWATDAQSGVANCDYEWMWLRIRQLTDEGYQVISTFQYFETYRHYVEPFEQRDFRSMADAGAVIVSGSQAHHPMAMEFYMGSFIHYGLGNLFFDQMHTGGLIPDATRKEFIDRHVFYNNRHISTELLTAMLEDYSRPRPMTPPERYDFLTEIFDVTDWGDIPQD